jgi:TatD DNase family protein
VPVQPDVPTLSADTSLPEDEVEGQATGAVDTHCHPFLMDVDIADVVSAARESGVHRLISVGIDPDSSRRSAELAESFRGVFATAGMHPHTASGLDRRAGAVIEELLSNPMVVAVGETGLDYYRRLSPPEDQRRAFRTHIALSRESGKPLVIHVREAWDDVLEILEEEHADRVVLHCFSGTDAAAREAEARGYFVSFAGNLTYPRTEGLRAAAASLAEDQVLAETDSPFLPPQNMRGKSNTPSNLVAVLRALGEARGLNLDRMVQVTERNAFQAFPLIR